MTTSPPSGSSPGSAPSAAFGLLHPKVQRWVWEQGWDELRDVQERSIPVLLEERRDVVIAAATAGGKTEAAFLPILSRIADAAETGFHALYVSPLKALINDQFRRLESLCEALGVPVTRWHGDVGAHVKAKARKDPAGVVLITPESLEALFVRRGPEAARLFTALRFVVVDEFHAFIGSERGVQLRSLLDRLEVILRRRIVRVALSATLGDMRKAADLLRPGGRGEAVILESRDGGQEIRLQIRGYLGKRSAPPVAPSSEVSDRDADDDPVRHAVADHLFKTLRGQHNLIFGGSRQSVEIYADLLRRRCEALGAPNEFFPHHGSLSREIREEAERRMRSDAPASVVCTTTLELGIDIGHVESVAQIGPPWTVAGLRQRLGRSGRRKGTPAVLRVYVEEQELDERTHPIDALRATLVQSVAMVELLLEHWFEPPEAGELHLSTLLHQTLALVAQYGGILPNDAYRILCRIGPFRNVDATVYAALLRRMGRPEVDLIEQARDGTLLLGRQGELLVEHYGFYAVFKTPEEFRMVAGNRTLGTLPIDSPLWEGALVIFAGLRWRVLRIRPKERVIEVERAQGGRPPAFGGEWGLLAEPVVRRMRRVWEDRAAPAYLDAKARELLVEGRTRYLDLGLDRRAIVPFEDRVLLFPWTGGRELGTLAAAVSQLGFEAVPVGLGLELRSAETSEVAKALTGVATGAITFEAATLARTAVVQASSKYDDFLGDELLAIDYARRALRIESLPGLCRALLDSVFD